MQSAEQHARAGHEALSRGDLADAIAHYHAAIGAEPAHLQARLGLAQIAFHTGNLDQALTLVEGTLAVHPESVECNFRHGLVLAAAGRTVEAIESFERAARLGPTLGISLVKKGMLELQAGREEDAAKSFQRALAAQPGLSRALEDERLPQALREEMTVAIRTLRARYIRMLDETLQLTHEHFPPAQTARLQACFAILRGEREKAWSDPRQRPEFLLLPNLTARPWFEREEFDWCERVEAAYPQVLAEYDRLTEAREEFEPYIHGTGDGADAVTPQGTDFSSLAGSRRWTAFHLERAGTLDANRARCPDTSALMDTLPLARADGYMPEVFFSLLEPGAHIVPHYGQMNVRLTVHLALRTPADCAIRVGEETRAWRPGRLLIFDDSFEHEAWNRSDEDRGVLIFEVWHPALNEAEIFGLQAFFRTRHAWMSRFGSPSASSSSSGPIQGA